MMLNPATPGRPQARTATRPSRMEPRERLRSAATARRLQAVESDWLFQSVSAEARTRLLVDHGLLPKAALGARPR